MVRNSAKIAPTSDPQKKPRPDSSCAPILKEKPPFDATVVRTELDEFDGFDTIVPLDLLPGEHAALLDLWARLGGRTWLRGETWRYAENANDWEGVTVLGGQKFLAANEEYLERDLEKNPIPTHVTPDGKVEQLITKYRKGDPRFKKDEEVLVRSVAGVPGGGFDVWRADMHPLRPARVLLVAVRGKGTDQRVEYDLRYLDGFVVELDLTHNNLGGTLPRKEVEKISDAADVDGAAVGRERGGGRERRTDINTIASNGSNGGEATASAGDQGSEDKGTNTQASSGAGDANTTTTDDEVEEPSIVSPEDKAGTNSSIVGEATFQMESEQHGASTRTAELISSEGGSGVLASEKVLLAGAKATDCISSSSSSSGNDANSCGERTASNRNIDDVSNESRVQSAGSSAPSGTPKGKRRPPMKRAETGATRKEPGDGDGAGSTTTLTATLPHLRRLLIAGNKIGGTIDAELLRWRLTGRLELQLYDNEPGFLLPPDIGKLAASQLVEVDLSSCSLRGPLVDGIGELGPTVRVLRLDNNRLEGELNAEALVKLTNLQTLSVARNRLTGPLPALLVMLYRSLRVLRLEDNLLEGPIPPEWANLEMLEEAHFGRNPEIDELRDGWIGARLPSCLVVF